MLVGDLLVAEPDSDSPPIIANIADGIVTVRFDAVFFSSSMCVLDL